MGHPTPVRERFQLPILLGLFVLLYLGVTAVEWRTLRRQAVYDAKMRAQTLTEVLQRNIEIGLPLWRLLELLDDPNYYRYLDELAHHHLRELGLAKFKVYDARGILRYAEDPSLVGQDHSGKAVLRQALAGETASTVVRPKVYQDLYGVEQHSSLVETYTPVHDREDRVSHVIEVYQDFDRAAQRVWAGTVRVALELGLLMAAAFGAVFWLTRRIHSLEREVDVLEQLLPICAHCKKIRTNQDGAQTWLPVDQYFHEQRDVDFTHGICDECLAKFYPEA